MSSLLPLHIYRPLSDGGHLVRIFRLVCDPHGDPYGDADPSQLYFSYTNLLEGLCHIVAEVARLPVTRGKKHADAAAARGKANAPPPPVGASPLAWLKWIVLPSRLLKLAQHPAAALRATLAADADVQAVLRAQRPRLVALFRALLAKLGDADATTLPADALVARLSWCGVLGVHTVASADGGAPSRAELSEHEVRAAALASYGALLVRRYPRPAVVLLTVDEVAEALYRCGDALYSEVESMPAPRRLEAVFDHICGRSTVADQLRGAAPRSQFAPLRGESPAMFEAWRAVWKAMGLGEWQGAAGWEADAYSLLHSHFSLLCALFAAHGGGGPLESLDGARLPRVGWRRLLGRLSLDADAGPLGDATGAPLSIAAAIQAIVYLSLPPARRPPLSQIPNLLADVPKADPFDAPAAAAPTTVVPGGRHEVLRTKVGAGGEEGGVGLPACLGYAARRPRCGAASDRRSRRGAGPADGRRRHPDRPVGPPRVPVGDLRARLDAAPAGGREVREGTLARASPATASFSLREHKLFGEVTVPPPKGAVGSGKVALRIALDESAARAAFAAAASPETGRLSGFDTISFDEFVEALAGCAEVRYADVRQMNSAQRLEGTVHELLGAADVARVVAAANKANEPSRYAFMNCPRLPSENTSMRDAWLVLWPSIALSALPGFPRWDEPVHHLLHESWGELLSMMFAMRSRAAPAATAAAAGVRSMRLSGWPSLATSRRAPPPPPPSRHGSGSFRLISRVTRSIKCSRRRIRRTARSISRCGASIS